MIMEFRPMELKEKKDGNRKEEDEGERESREENGGTIGWRGCVMQK